MRAKKKAADPTLAEHTPRRVQPQATLMAHVRPRLAEQAIPIRELLQLQRTAGNKAVGLLVGPRFSGTTVVQRQPQGTPDSTGSLASPVSPEEMFRQIVEYQRAIKAMPKGAPPATGTVDPKGVGTPSGHGTWTGAAIQVLDASGKRVDIGYGMYAGGDHGEIRAIKALDHLRSRKDLAGGTIIVVVEKKPCKSCAPALEAFAKDLGLREVKVYGPTRSSARSPKKKVSHKTAAQTSLQGKRPKTTVELIYSKRIGTSTPSPGPGPSGSKPPATPTATPKSSKQPPSTPALPAPKPATRAKPPAATQPPSPGKGKWVSAGVDQKTSRARLKVNWNLLGKAGTALSGSLQIWNALSTLDSAMKKLERIQSGGIDPQISKIFQAIDNTFSQPDKLAKDVSNDQFRQGIQSMAWLETSGKKWIDDQGRISLPPQFDEQERQWAHATIGYHIAIVNNHIDHLEIIEDALIGYLTLLGPLEAELTRRVRALFDISQELWNLANTFRYVPFAFDHFGFLALQFEEAARDLGLVDSHVSYRSYECDRWLLDVTGKDIPRARSLLETWGPRWQATGGRVGSN